MIKKVEHITSRESVASSARICYSKNIISPIDTVNWVTKMNDTDSLIKELIKAGHNTTFEHYYLTLQITGYSRHFIWRYLHGLNDFYSTDQQSQRYVDLSDINNFYIPQFLDKEDKEKWKFFYNFCNTKYNELKILLEKKLNNKKQALEIARYVLPLGQTPNLVHTINFITIIRYIALFNKIIKEDKENIFELKEELSKFKEELKEILLKERKNFKPFYEKIIRKLKQEISNFVKEKENINLYNNHKLKESLEKLNDKFQILVKKINIIENYEKIYINLINELIKEEEKKINIKDFQNNNFNKLIENNINDINNIETKVLSCNGFLKDIEKKDYNFYPFIKNFKSLINFITLGKITHSADSQNQRHRTTIKIRPLLKNYYNLLSNKYYIPNIIKEDKELLELYNYTIKYIYQFFEENSKKYDFNNVLYLLPNSHFVIIIDNDNMEYFTHKAQKRLCFNAQEEIWNFTYQQVNQLKDNFNLDIKVLNLLPPCHVRNKKNIKPICAEGKRFCGIKVWNIDFEELKRNI